MTIDFVLKKSPALRIAAIRWKGPYSESTIRKKFAEVEGWARANHVRTGRWVFREPGTNTWDVAIEVRGAAHSEGRVKIQTIPACTVASVAFDPDVVSPRVVYHGLSDWLRWRRKEKKVRTVLSSRELYPGDPWKIRSAWAHTEVQFVVRT